MELKKPLLGLTLTELQAITQEHAMPSFAAKQIADWIYRKRVTSIEEMSNLSLGDRQKLCEHYEIGAKKYQHLYASVDGTKKYLFATTKGNGIESALIPHENHYTLCVSTQVGCKMGCLFCMTGKQGFQGQLSTNEIINQIYSIDESEQLTNIVYMGMGEPLDNYSETIKSIEIMTADYAYAWSPKRITVSTVGVIPTLIRFLEESKCNLAVSLHSPFDEERLQLMPIQNVYPIKEVIQVLKAQKNQARISFEYILFAGVNDSQKHVNELARLLNGLSAHINLMRFHAIPNSPLKGTSEEKLKEFQAALNKKGIITTIRA
ncbi:MAG: 23S rRNA (adenine(2503)-C(2))-methyltransferase RlmN, partial [Oligoflexia bacterium]|nr:23S rRNA (adenine(2503)-C(2))-methyltransferase RlmN [Oligoflexia bacterium]